MKMLAATTALATSVALAALFSSEAAYAQRYRAAPKSYAAPNSYGSVHDSLRDPRFTDEEQRIIDAITRNSRNSGY
jgi:hypothetical protein